MWSFLLDEHFKYAQLYVILKNAVLPHISSLSSQILKKSMTEGYQFFQKNVLSTHTVCYLEKCSICPISPLQVVGLKNFMTKGESFLNKPFEYPPMYVILKNAISAPEILSK